MKILRKDLYNISDVKQYDVNEDDIVIDNNIFIKEIKKAEGYIDFYYDQDDNLFINYELKGMMICPDSLTLEDVEVPFDLYEDEKVTDNPNEEGFYFVEDKDVREMIRYIVIPEVPIKVEKCKETMYYSGDGWSISTEEEYNKNSKDRIDPRLEKLLEYKEED